MMIVMIMDNDLVWNKMVTKTDEFHHSNLKPLKNGLLFKVIELLATGLNVHVHIYTRNRHHLKKKYCILIRFILMNVSVYNDVHVHM